jgi:lipopolysaccharide/colanic/teichoic acid biosynthesis glycosyltransferase
MTLVGPRPEVPDVLDLYGGYKAEYVSVKPGITCLSKISGRDNLTKRETIEMDLAYIRSASLRMDISILLKTLKSVLLRQDVYDGGGTVKTMEQTPE